MCATTKNYTRVRFVVGVIGGVSLPRKDQPVCCLASLRAAKQLRSILLALNVTSYILHTYL